MKSLNSFINAKNLTTQQVTGPVSVNYALSAMILTGVEITHPDYIIQTFHIYLLLLLLLLIEGVLTMNSTKFIGRLNEFGTIVNIAVIFIFIIWMPAGSINEPKSNPNREVWTNEGIVNGTEWPTGFAFMMGFLSVIVSVCCVIACMVYADGGWK